MPTKRGFPGSRPGFAATVGLIGLAGLALGEPAEVPSSRVDEAVSERSEAIRERLDQGLFHEWFGDDAWLSSRGVLLRMAVTGFAQDAWSGASTDSADFGGKVSALLRLDGGKLGLWEGLSLTAHSEVTFGESINASGLTVLPMNLAMQVPGAATGSRHDISSLFLTQRFGESVTLILGKTNLADLAALHPYAGGTGVTGFMNGGLAAAPNGAMPPYVYGGALVFKTDRVIYNLALYGGDNAVGELDFGSAFDDGFLLSGGVTVPVNLGGHPGQHSLTLVWGDREIPNLNALGDLLPPGAIGSLNAIDTERLLLRYAFFQQLGTFDGDARRGWGVWGRAQLAENDLTAVRWSLAGGIGGASPLPGRDGDRWGLGVFRFSFADFLRDPAIVRVPLQDEYGLELFYNFHLRSWLQVTADLQVVRPGISTAGETALIGGLRTSLRF